MRAITLHNRVRMIFFFDIVNFFCKIKNYS
jgi:hypothetical protein